MTSRAEMKMMAKHGQAMHKVRHETMMVSPEQAAEWLEKSKGNRRISQKHIDRMVREIQADKWELTHQAIAFDQDGRLIDGQQRLWAVVLAGISVAMVVAKNVRRSAAAVIDTGRSRTLQDRLTIRGQWGEVTRQEASCLRRMIRGTSLSMVMTPGEELTEWSKHTVAVRFALASFPKRVRGLTTSVLAAVIARAWYHGEHARLLRFSSDAACESGPCATLKDRFRKLDDGSRYRLVESIVWLYTHHESPRLTGELFPLEGELGTN